MDSKSGGHDSRNLSDDMAHGASHDTSSERQNCDQSLLQRISVNSEQNFSWIDQIEELDNNGVVITQGKVITSGPDRPTGASEEGPKNPCLIMSRYPSESPRFPTDMSKFENARDCGQAVIMNWAKWRKEKKINLHAEKEATRAFKKDITERIDNQNKCVVSSGAYSHGHGCAYVVYRLLKPRSAMLLKER